MPTTDLWQSVAEGQHPAGVCTHTLSCVCSLFVCWGGDHEHKTIKSFQNQQTENTGEFRKVTQISFLLVLQCDTVMIIIIIIIILGAGTRFHSNNILKDKIQNEMYTFCNDLFPDINN